MKSLQAGFQEIPIFQSFKDELVAAQSSRLSGSSVFPFQSLNLGLFSNDKPGNIVENRQRFFSNFDIDPENIAHSFQVHGSKIKRVEYPGLYQGYDALITNKPGIYLAVSIADCVPVLVYDPKSKAVSAIHAGWRGTKAEILTKTIDGMTDAFNTNPRDCFAFIGTCIGSSNFEVDADVADHFEDSLKKWDKEKEKYFVDLKAANRELLLKAGVQNSKIGVSPFCTVEHNESFFSYRKEAGQTGRMLAIIGVKS